MSADELYAIEVRANDCSGTPYANGQSELIIKWTSAAEDWQGNPAEFAAARAWAASTVARVALGVLQQHAMWTRVGVSTYGLGADPAADPGDWSDVTVILAVPHSGLHAVTKTAEKVLTTLADYDPNVEGQILSDWDGPPAPAADGTAPAPRAHLAVVQHDGGGAA